VEERVTAGMEAVDKADSEKGEKTLYMVSITDNIKQMWKHFDTVKSHGGNGILVNYFCVGFSTVMEMTQEKKGLVIMGHMDFGGNYYSAAFQGMAGHLAIGKIPRLIGCDTTVMPAPYGKAYTLNERFQQQLMNQRLPLHHIKPGLPMPSGGITPGMVEQCVKDCGVDVLIGSGGGIHAHPDGATAGAKAFRQAVDAAMKGIPQKDYAKDHKELAQALGLWGSKRTGV
jgi:2,3-diketo-5-methylthiopentyl-1-phosphate enolase